MKDATARDANREVLRNTTSALEVLLAARNLENAAPGAHREEALNAMLAVLSRSADLPELKDGSDETSLKKVPCAEGMFAIAVHYQAVEVMPRIDEVVKGNPLLAREWLAHLPFFPEADQSASVGSLLTDESLTSYLGEHGFYMKGLNFQSPALRQFFRAIFTNATDMDKSVMITFLGDSTILAYGLEQPAKLMQPGSGKGSSSFVQSHRDGMKLLDGTAQLLLELDPSVKSEEVRQALEKKRSKIQQSRQELAAQIAKHEEEEVESAAALKKILEEIETDTAENSK